MKQRAVIGIEISSEEVRGAWVRPGSGGMHLAGVASASMPPNAIDAEGLLNAAEVGETVRRVCSQLDPKANQVVVGITGCSLVARVMEIPPVPDAEVRPVLRGEMDHYRILPAGQSAFDFYRLPPLVHPDDTAEEEAVDRVLLMGAEERLVAGYRAAVDASGLNLTAVEPGSIAVLRALYPLLQHEDAVATVFLSGTGTDIFITQRGGLQFYRRVDTGTHELLARAPQPNAGTPSANPGRRSLLMGQDEEDQTPITATTALDPYNRQAVSLLMTEVQRSIDYYIREFPQAGEKMTVRFSIDAPNATDLFAVMTQYLRSEAEMASVVDCLPVEPLAAQAVHGVEGYKYTVAVGLALRSVGGAYASAPCLDLGVGDVVIVERRMAPRVMVASLSFTGIILLGTMAAAIVVGRSISRANAQLTHTKAELQMLVSEHMAKVAQIERQKNLVEAIHRRDKPLRETMEFLSAAVSQNACLTSLTIDNNGKIFLSGEADSPRIVADIMDKINMSPILEPIRLDNLMRKDINSDTPTLKFDLQTGILPFRIEAAELAAPAAPPTKPNAAPGSPQNTSGVPRTQGGT